MNSKLGRQHTKAPLAAALSPSVSLLYPPNPWCEWCNEWRLTTTPLVHAHVIHPWKYPDLHTQKVEQSANKAKPPEQSHSAKTQAIKTSYSPGTQPSNIFLSSSKQHPPHPIFNSFNHRHCLSFLPLYTLFKGSLLPKSYHLSTEYSLGHSQPVIF